jgi:hypothetical protein
MIMSEVSIKQVTHEKDWKDFIEFPMRLYRNNSNYVPPLIKDEKEIWDSLQNPALAYSEARQFLAFKNNEVVGRIAVIINHKEAEELGIKKVRFGWLDFIDDEAVSRALPAKKESARLKALWDLPISIKQECSLWVLIAWQP